MKKDSPFDKFKGKRVLVCGGRDYNDLNVSWAALRFLAPVEIIEGGARGADGMARGYSHNILGRPPKTFKADWDKHGKAAGHIRNAQMLAEGKPDYVLAFPGGRGTEDMVSKAKAAKVPVIRVDTDGVMEEVNGN